MTDSERGVAAEGCRDRAHGNAEDQDLRANRAAGQGHARKTARRKVKLRKVCSLSVDKRTHSTFFAANTLEKTGSRCSSNLPRGDIAYVNLL